MPKKLLRSIAITAVFAGGYFATDAITEPTVVEASTMVTINGYQYSKEVVETLNLINAERKKMGCDELKINSKLSKSAEAHAKYLTTNVKGASHDETKGKAGFTGADHGERAKSAGYTLTEYDGETHNGESITYGTGLTPAKVVSLTIQGVYHRDTILNPDYDTIGIGIDGGAYVFVTDNSDFSQTRGLNTYPYNGQTDVPTTFSMNEKPNPLAGYGVTKAGYIVSGMPSQPESLSSDIYIFITDSKGNNVPVLEKDNISSVANAGNFVIPKEPLKEDETYTVTMNYLLRGTKEKGTDTWSFTTAKSGTSVVTPTPTPPVANTQDYSSYAKKFADFSTTAWWRDDMIWAIDKGLISGYGNVWNSKTKKYETQLQPNTQLTEAHFLTIFFRFTQKNELASIQNTSSWNKSGLYNMAKKYKMPVLATEESTTSKGLADKGIRRGKLAQLMASYYYGKTVSENEAIQFFMENEITTAKSIDAYNPDQILTRSQISAFIQRYESIVSKQK